MQRSTEDLLIFLGAAQQFGERIKTVLAREDHTQQEKDGEWAKTLKEAQEKMAERDARRRKGDEILARMGLLRPEEMPSVEKMEDTLGVKMRQDQLERFSTIMLAAYRKAELEIDQMRVGQSRSRSNVQDVDAGDRDRDQVSGREQAVEDRPVTEKERKRQEARQRFAERRSSSGPDRDDDDTGRQRVRSRGISM